MQVETSSGLTIPKSRFDQFMREYDRDGGLRLGQAFHQFMNLEKCVQEKAWCDRLYQASSAAAKSMIMDRLDYTQ